jgi:heat shock protein HslJ
VRRALALLVVALIAASAAGCGNDDGESADASSLEGVPWVLVDGIDVEGWEDAAPSATFESERVSGSTGCNRYNASHTVDEDALELAAIVSTRMACVPPRDEVERAFLGALERVAGWRVDADELVLVDVDDEELLRFGAATPVGSSSVTGVLRGDAFVSAIAGTEITATFSDEGELSGSAGCNTYTATYTTDGGAIEITPPAATKKLCPDPEGVMEQEAAYLEGLASAARYRVDGGALELSTADGTRVVHFTQD